MAAATRLRWQTHPEGGFIAYPEGWKDAALQRVVDALSAEFHRRRLGN